MLNIHYSVDLFYEFHEPLFRQSVFHGMSLVGLLPKRGSKSAWSVADFQHRPDGPNDLQHFQDVVPWL